MITVTIGISAYNEESNIEYLLRSILSQKQTGYELMEIIVISDKSTDKTADIVKKFTDKHPLVKLVCHTQQCGKTVGMIEIFSWAKGEIIVMLDGDIVLGKKTTLSSLIAQFTSQNVVMVSGNPIPVKATSFTETLINVWEEVWYETRKDVNNGDVIYNAPGAVFALRTSFTQTIKLNKKVLSTSKYIYFYVHFKNLEYRFAKDAIVFYRSPSTTFDFLVQSKRTFQQQNKQISTDWIILSDTFGSWIYEKFKIPLKNKIIAVGKVWLRYPFLVPLAYLYITIVNFIPLREKTILNKELGLFKTVTSTKRGINTIDF